MSQNKLCWQCQNSNTPSALFCENKVCKVIQPMPADLNFFDLLQAGAGEHKYVYKDLQHALYIDD
jgi:molecular chaperone HscB